MSKDRETTDTTNSGGGGGVRFRNQSPSTHRRSRDRERTTAAADSSSKTLAAKDSIDANNMTAVIGNESSLADYTDHFDDSRLSDEMGYQSFTSEEIDIGGVGSTIALVQGEGHIGSSGRHHHRTNSGQALDRLNTKLACTRESIRKEQTARDGEFLKIFIFLLLVSQENKLIIFFFFLNEFFKRENF